MKRKALTIVGLVFTLLGYGQTSQITYYNNESLDKEVSQEKAKYSKTVTRSANNIVITEVRNLKSDEIIRSDGYKGAEPYGVWRYWSTSGIKVLDYNFDLPYSTDQCSSTLRLTGDELITDDTERNYTAPKLESGVTIYSLIGKITIYPRIAKEEGIQGAVFLRFLVTKEGKIEGVSVSRGVHPVLDKEAARVIRQLQFTEPPSLNGEPVSVCVTMPVYFRLN
jgi:TonB family protein